MAQVSSSGLQSAPALSAITKALALLGFTFKFAGVTFGATTEIGYAFADGIKANADGFHDLVAEVKNTLNKSLNDFATAVRDGASFSIASLALEGLLSEQKGIESLGANLIGKSDAVKAYSLNAALILQASKACLDVIHNKDNDSSKSSTSGFIDALGKDILENSEKSVQATLITAVVASMKEVPNKVLVGTCQTALLGLVTAFSASESDALAKQSATYKWVDNFCDNDEKCSEFISRYTEEAQTKGKVILAAFLVVVYGLYLNLQSYQNASYVKLNPNSDPLAKNLGKIANSDVTFNCVTSQYTTGPSITFESVLEVAIKQFLKPNTTFGKLL